MLGEFAHRALILVMGRRGAWTTVGPGLPRGRKKTR